MDAILSPWRTFPLSVPLDKSGGEGSSVHAYHNRRRQKILSRLPYFLPFRKGQSYPRIGTKLSTKRSPIPPSALQFPTCTCRLLTRERRGVYQSGIDFFIELQYIFTLFLSPTATHCDASRAEKGKSLNFKVGVGGERKGKEREELSGSGRAGIEITF